MLTPSMPPAPRPARRTRGGAARAGFTLVELLVACALTVLVMAILATAFGKGMETLSTLKSAVGLSEQFRAAEAVIRRDLASDHLESRNGGPVRVSDRRHATAAWGFPDKGFFRIKHGSAPVYENIDEGVNSYRADNHELAMTVKLRGGSASDVFIADMGGLPTPADTNLLAQSQSDLVPFGVPPTQFAGPWAEVGYFLAPSAMSTSSDDASPPLPLYTLRRRVRALAPSSTVSVPLTASQTPEIMAQAFPELSISPVQIGVTPPNKFATINTPADVTIPANRMWDFNPLVDARPSKFTFQVRAIPASNALGGSDVLLANVVSFQVSPLTSADTTRFVDLLPAAYSPSAALDTTDAATAASPKPVMRAVQIRVRLYDVRNRLTRQMTFVQDL